MNFMKVEALYRYETNQASQTEWQVFCGLCGSPLTGIYCGKCSTENIVSNDYSKEEVQARANEVFLGEEIRKNKEQIMVLIKCNNCGEKHQKEKGSPNPSMCSECEAMYTGFSEISN